MRDVLIGGYAAFFAVVVGVAALVASCAREAKQRADALKVLKYLAPGGLSVGAVGVVLIKLHEHGLL
ncbi:hypothetical protein [Kutzneria albida]|uniref:Uncharacterized protein n=1 Tax=Kutzneria albida DSM 43870 TaxID=1449976 RepID=W5WDB4_9PSEU|nr:hypothetical protein [Kutzneria albida]AHH98576.1 hypothetical protein KALB_5214 [Kutzneria albida DSM 43870]